MAQQDFLKREGAGFFALLLSLWWSSSGAGWSPISLLGTVYLSIKGLQAQVCGITVEDHIVSLYLGTSASNKTNFFWVYHLQKKKVLSSGENIVEWWE